MKLALCNEVLAPMAFDAQCRLIAQLGYDGIELAPFTVAGEQGVLSPTQVAEVRRQADDCGLQICALHWLLAKPQGLSITSNLPAIRERTWAAMQRHIECCAELGARVLVHGSPAQRRLPIDGAAADVEAARQRGIELLSRAGELATRCGVSYAIEPLAPATCNFINTLDQAAAVIGQCPQANLRLTFDTLALSASEQRPLEQVLDQWLPRGLIAHVQLNDPSQRAPGQGKLSFAGVLRALRRHHYAGWVSVEPFDYFPDGPTCAARAIGYLRGIEESLN